LTALIVSSAQVLHASRKDLAGAGNRFDIALAERQQILGGLHRLLHAAAHGGMGLLDAGRRGRDAVLQTGHGAVDIFLCDGVHIAGHRVAHQRLSILGLTQPGDPHSSSAIDSACCGAARPQLYDFPKWPST
jgi:hypothetical protein